MGANDAKTFPLLWNLGKISAKAVLLDFSETWEI